MLFVVCFEDNPDKASARAQFMSAHLAYLEANSRKILAAGPLRDTASGGAAGGQWLVEAGSAEEVATLYKEDPFWPTGLRKSVRVLEWSQVFANGKRLI